MDQQNQASLRSDQVPPVQDGLVTDASPGTAGVSRRSLLRGGAAVSPVLLTMASGPVGATATCVVASSFVSVAEFASRNAGKVLPKCTSVTADYWYANACRRRSGSDGLDNDVTMGPIMMASCSTHFGTAGPSSTYRNKKVYQMFRENASCGSVSAGKSDADGVWNGSISQGGLLGVTQHLLTLSLSYKNNKFALAPGYFNDGYFKGVWTRLTPTGQYNHPDGIVWSAAQTISWLRLLQYPAV